MNAQIKVAAGLIKQADALVIGAGAGMGVDSGLPDFRGNQGFWGAYPALAKARLEFMDVASPRTFEQDPTLAWGFYGHRLNLYRSTTPHQGFEILRKWAESKPLGAWIFTSNVDGQFQKAGFQEAQINECHGSIHHLQCMNNCRDEVWPTDHFSPEVDHDACRLTNGLPVCPACGEMARPNVLMFGDWSWSSTRNQLQQRREQVWMDHLASSCPNVVVVELGAGISIPSVRHFSHSMSRGYGATIIRINPRENSVPSSKDVGLPMGALEGVQCIDDVLQVSLT
jgi:NAD-dependent SIR2 family protein deacetylase